MKTKINADFESTQTILKMKLEKKKTILKNKLIKLKEEKDRVEGKGKVGAEFKKQKKVKELRKKDESGEEVDYDAIINNAKKK